MLSLSRKDCCCILQSGNNTVHWQRLCAGLQVARLCSPVHVAKWCGQDLANASFCARCAAVERCKRQLGRTGTPCGHFTPDAAPPLSRCFAHISPTAPPISHYVQLHLPAALYPHFSISMENPAVLASSGATEGVPEMHADPYLVTFLCHSLDKEWNNQSELFSLQ